MKQLAALAALAVLLAGCTPRAHKTIVRTTTTTTETSTATLPHVAADKYVPTLEPGSSTPKGEVERRCPYIRTGLNEDANGYDESAPNVADLEGDRIYRTTVLTRLHPVGCRFYFYAPPYEAVADIVPHTYPSVAGAHNALIATARLGTEPISQPNFVRGVDGILYRTRFFADDGARDWAFAFAKGRVLVVVHTQRKDTSLNALELGKAIVAKF